MDHPQMDNLQLSNLHIYHLRRSAIGVHPILFEAPHITPLGPQSPFGENPLNNQVGCSQYGAAVLKGIGSSALRPKTDLSKNQNFIPMKNGMDQ